MARGRRKKPQKKQSFFARINQQIRVPQVRLVAIEKPDGERVPIEPRVIRTQEAISMAREYGLDLVEISDKQNPPICKIMDYGKYKFMMEKKNKESKKKQHVVHVKEIKLRPKIDTNDYQIKLKKAKEFLSKGDKVKVSLRFRGREVVHSELGMEVMIRMRDDLAEISRVEKTPELDGRQIVMVLAPQKQKPKSGS